MTTGTALLLVGGGIAAYYVRRAAEDVHSVARAAEQVGGVAGIIGEARDWLAGLTSRDAGDRQSYDLSGAGSAAIMGGGAQGWAVY